ncbi:MAG: D-aminoacylase [Bacteroidetes bacterium]|nr:D-aminoacylase [Bacteroidota bacterium]MBU1372044.1 D-aminoacylase [Bacteroidota bacterium]MBU1483646.1 D-aminoacylase [Bacteroidota bacterium]MBU1761549.1 D-aminoacylase [Bacteroidota bacterium]MBU2267152.1 D-aminoacylase [Bacteroidota bacterium]
MKYFTILFLILSSFVVKAQQYDILIKNARILDGTGNSWYKSDLAVKGNLIVKIAPFINGSATKVIDAKNNILSPGFIDVHTHIEGDEAKTPTAQSFVYDGVTSVITGNCGSSQTNIKKYLDFIDSVKLSINVGVLIGHNDVRKLVMGKANRDPLAQELEKMEAIVAQGMKDGAVGLSTGLIYIPGTYTKTPEIVALAKVASKYHGVYATHMRSESDQVKEAITEALTIGKEANLPVEISHFKIGGQQNWGESVQTLAMVKQARLEGMDVTIDQYPYTASSTSISTLVPDDILADGQDSINARLANPEIRKKAIEEMLASLKRRKLKHFDYAVVAYYTPDTSYNGKSIEEINLMRGGKHQAKAEAETVLCITEHGGASAVFHGMGDDDLKNIMKYPFNMPASDAGIREFGAGMPHPRGYGTNARVLGKYVREEHIITLEEAIRRMTSLPAQKFQLKDRGLIKEGMKADIVIFNPETVIDKATYEKPHAFSTGFEYVLVNGGLTVENGKHTGARNGMALRHAY